MTQELKEAVLPITGMTCASCAIRIEKGLKKVEGVEDANVNFALERTSIKYNPNVVQIDEFKKKINDLGYDVVEEKVELNIIGMTCAACATRIEKGLNKIEGVTKANVNLALESATVEYNPSQTGLNDMLQRVEKLGYKATLKDDQKEDLVDMKAKELETQQGKFLFSLILSVLNISVL